MTKGRLILVAAALATAALSPAFILHGQVGPDGDIDITITEGTMFAAVASPDRRSIAIDLVGALWVLPIDGGEARRITPDTIEARRPTWSPDSQSLAFQGYDEAWHIYTIKTDGTGLKAITTGPFDDQEPDWSRDGRRIAFSSDRFGGRSSIWQVEVGSGAVRQLSRYVGNDPCWSPTDRDVLFGGRPNPPAQPPVGVWLAGPDGRPEQWALTPATIRDRQLDRLGHLLECEADAVSGHYKPLPHRACRALPTARIVRRSRPSG